MAATSIPRQKSVNSVIHTPTGGTSKNVATTASLSMKTMISWEFSLQKSIDISRPGKHWQGLGVLLLLCSAWWELSMWLIQISQVLRGHLKADLRRSSVGHRRSGWVLSIFLSWVFLTNLQAPKHGEVWTDSAVSYVHRTQKFQRHHAKNHTWFGRSVVAHMVMEISHYWCYLCCTALCFLCGSFSETVGHTGNVLLEDLLLFSRCVNYHSAAEPNDWH